MSKIIKHWEIHDFCASHGRVIPINEDAEGRFTKFYCADRNHDDSETIDYSDEQGYGLFTLAGILSMSGYVVQFDDKSNYLFCTKQELDSLLASEKEQEEETNIDTSNPHNPARPEGLKITREDMVIEYKAYERCTEYPLKIHAARARGYLTPPYFFGDTSYLELLCKDDCIFCTCPFYSRRQLDELRHNHRNDYDEWVMDFFKDFDRNK